jgi:hypothetical protein
MLERDAAGRLIAEILQAAPETRISASGGECVYFDEFGYPVCVIGHVFEKIGIGQADLAPTATRKNPNGARVCSLSYVWNGKISQEAADFLQDVQDGQDTGHTWGDIYRVMYLGEDFVSEKSQGGEEDAASDG